MRYWCRLRSPSNRRGRRALIAGCLGLALTTSPAPAHAAPASSAPARPATARAGASREYAVVVSSDVDMRTLTVAELRRIFLLERRFWKSGKPIVALMPSNGAPSRHYLLRGICGIDEAQFRQLLLEKMYRGEIDLAPKVVASDEEALSFVAASRGLIALVPANLAASARVRVLEIGGKSLGTAGFPLKE